jgi:hypothetical protein
VDEKAHLGIQAPRAVIEIHRADEKHFAIEHVQLRMQGIVAKAGHPA